MTDSFEKGFELFEDEMKSYAKRASEDHMMSIMESIAKSFTKDLRKIPKPMSQIRKAGYTHLVDTFTYRKAGKIIEIGWGKYYGLMLEKGTKKWQHNRTSKRCGKRTKINTTNKN